MIYLLPLGIILLGAALLLTPKNLFGPRPLRIISLIFVCLALFILTLSRNSGEVAVGWNAWVGQASQPVLKGGYLPLGLVFVILNLFVVQLATRDTKPALVASGLLITAAGLGFLLSWDVVALCLGWGLLDVSIIVVGGFLSSGDPRNIFGRAILLNFVGGLAWVCFTSYSLLDDPTGKAASLLSVATALFYLAVCLRLAVYPLSMGLSLAERLPNFTSGALLLALLAAGAHLLEFEERPGPTGALLWLWPLLGAITIIYAALSLWLGSRSRTFCLAQFQIGTLLLLPLTGNGEGFLLWAIGTILALGFWQAFEEIFPRLHNARLRLVATAAALLVLAFLAGIPFSLAFAARLPLLALGPAVQVVQILGSASILPPLLRVLFKSELEGEGLEGNRAWASVLCLATLATPLFLLGVYTSLKEVRSSLVPWLIAVIPLFLAYGGFRFWGRIKTRLLPFQQFLDYLELEWPYAALEKAGATLVATTRDMARVLESRRSLGWLVLALVIVMMYLRT